MDCQPGCEHHSTDLLNPKQTAQGSRRITILVAATRRDLRDFAAMLPADDASAEHLALEFWVSDPTRRSMWSVQGVRDALDCSCEHCSRQLGFSLILAFDTTKDVAHVADAITELEYSLEAVRPVLRRPHVVIIGNDTALAPQWPRSPLLPGETVTPPLKGSAEHVIWLNPQPLAAMVGYVEMDPRGNAGPLSGLNRVVMARASLDALTLPASGSRPSDLRDRIEAVQELDRQVVQAAALAANPFTGDSTAGTPVLAQVTPRMLPPDRLEQVTSSFTLQAILGAQLVAMDQQASAEVREQRTKNIERLASAVGAAILIPSVLLGLYGATTSNESAPSALGLTVALLISFAVALLLGFAVYNYVSAETECESDAAAIRRHRRRMLGGFYVAVVAGFITQLVVASAFNVGWSTPDKLLLGMLVPAGLFYLWSLWDRREVTATRLTRPTGTGG